MTPLKSELQLRDDQSGDGNAQSRKLGVVRLDDNRSADSTRFQRLALQRDSQLPAIAQRAARGADVESLDISGHLDVESGGALSVDHQRLRELFEPGRVGVNGAQWEASQVH